MANLQETDIWVDGIYQLETTDPVEGGPDGIDNLQAKQLGSRTKFLKQQIEQLDTAQDTHANALDPHPQYLLPSEAIANFADVNHTHPLPTPADIGAVKKIGDTMTGALNEAHGADIASAATINLTTATGNLVDVTGTTTITAITLADGAERTVRFTGVLALTNGANLILPTGANINTAAGDFAVFRGYAAGVVRCVTYSRANGQALASGSFNGGTLSSALNEAHGADIASAATINLTTATGNLVDVTGTTAITAITLADGAERTVRFTGVLALTNGANLILPTGANINTAAGDFAVFRGYAAGVVRCVTYSRANGQALVSGTFTGGTLSSALNEAHGADIASAATINLSTATGNLVDVTGTTAITAITLADGAERTVRFTGVLALTNGANLVLPTGANINTAAGDFAVFRGYAAGLVRCVSYSRANGQALVSGTFTGGTLSSALNEAHGADIASAATINLTTATGNLVDVTGTTAITAITLADGAERTVRFTGVLTLTNGANLVLPTGANITTAAGDFAVFSGYSAGVVRCVLYSRANGQPLAMNGLANFTETVNSAAPNATVPVVTLSANNAATNVDLAIVPKGTGAIVAAVPDGTLSGGNKRGNRAVDLQMERSNVLHVAAGDGSVIAGGGRNYTSGLYSAILGGYSNSGGANYAAIGGGQSNAVTADYGTICGGYKNQVSGAASTIVGGQSATTRAIKGASAWAAFGDTAVAVGARQAIEFLHRVDTTNATVTRITCDGLTAAADNIITTPSNGALMYCRVRVVAKTPQGSGVECKSWNGHLLIQYNGSGNIVGNSVASDFATAGFTAPSVSFSWSVNSLSILVTGVAATNISWLAHIELLEVA